MNATSLTIHVQADTHGALEDGRVGVTRRTIALWCISLAQWLLRSRIDVSFVEGK